MSNKNTCKNRNTEAYTTPMKKGRPALVAVLYFIAVMFLMAVAFLSPAKAFNKRVLTDMAGRQVTLQAEAKRIITTFKPATLCLFSLGLENRLVGIDNSSKRDPLNRAVMPEVTHITGIGSKSTGINFEAIAALKPDLVILYAQKDGKLLADRLEKMSIPSIIILPENFNSICRSMALIARAAGCSHRAETVNKAINTLLLTVEKRVATLPADKKKSGYFASPRGLFSTATGNMLQDEMLTKAGIINVAGNLTGYFQDISPELFMEWNPDLVFISQHAGDRPFKQLENPALKRVRAVQTKNVYRFPSRLAPWDFPSPLSALGVLWLGCTAYPDLFSDINVNKMVDEFHKILFNTNLKDLLDSQQVKDLIAPLQEPQF